jgi:hypothetical protein
LGDKVRAAVKKRSGSKTGPSQMKCPKIGPVNGLPSRLGSDFIFIQFVSLDKAINPTFCVNDLLLTGVERVAIAANFYADCIFCGTKLYAVAANAGSNNIKVLGMNPFFHNGTLKYRQ